jgi:hypothetical protein
MTGALDTTLIESEYRRDYLRGFARGRAQAAREASEEGSASGAEDREERRMFSDDGAALFGGYLDDDSEAKEQFRTSLADMGAEEAAKCFEIAEQLAEGYVVAAEALDQCVYVVFADARWRAQEARRIAEGANASR